MLVTQPRGRAETGIKAKNEEEEEEWVRENCEGPLTVLTALPKQPGRFTEVISKEKAWTHRVNRVLFT